jgi:putative tryptophan/tyrosine transport system substrate-binding protein
VKRREFITLVGGAAAAWPLAAGAQQPERIRRIGVLAGFTENGPDSQARIAAFRRELEQLGWTDGRNVRIDYRWGGADPDRYRTYAAELVGLAPDVLLATNTSTVRALQKTTRSVPIVFATATDPIGGGLVASMSRPGGNITGFTLFEFGLSGKWVELLKEISPRVTRAAVLRNSTTTGGLE